MASIRDYLIGALIFSLVIISGVTFLGMMVADAPELGSDPQMAAYNSTFNKLNEVQGTVSSIQGQIEGSEPNLGAFGVLNALIEMGWNSVKLMFSSFGVMNSAYYGLSSLFGLPWYVPVVIIALVTVIIAFTILSAIFQREL